ncbi:MAG: hypothetical protein AAF901_14805, partial [Bacteroidota bacterium]
AFETSIGKSAGYINGLARKNGSPTAQVIVDIVDEYKNYSLNWILTGKGSMKTLGGILEEPEADYITSMRLDFKILNEKLDAIKKQNYQILDKLDQTEQNISED